jgi:hypothetical protein
MRDSIELSMRIEQGARMSLRENLPNTFFAPDFSLAYHGTIALLRPNNLKARRWLSEISLEGARFLASSLAIEPQYVPIIVHAATDAGFVVH